MEIVGFPLIVSVRIQSGFPTIECMKTLTSCSGVYVFMFSVTDNTYGFKVGYTTHNILSRLAYADGIKPTLNMCYNDIVPKYLITYIADERNTRRNLHYIERYIHNELSMVQATDSTTRQELMKKYSSCPGVTEIYRHTSNTMDKLKTVLKTLNNLPELIVIDAKYGEKKGGVLVDDNLKTEQPCSGDRSATLSILYDYAHAITDKYTYVDRVTQHDAISCYKQALRQYKQLNKNSTQAERNATGLELNNATADMNDITLNNRVIMGSATINDYARLGYHIKYDKV